MISYSLDAVGHCNACQVLAGEKGIFIDARSAIGDDDISFTGRTVYHYAVYDNGHIGALLVFQPFCRGESVLTDRGHTFGDVYIRKVFALQESIPASIKTIGESNFINCAQLTVNYGGSRSQWNKIKIEYGNLDLDTAVGVEF